MRSSHKRNGSRGSSPAIQPGNAVVRRLRFRHLLEEKGIGKLFLDAISRCLERAGRMMRGGSIADAALSCAPGSAKNAEKNGTRKCTRRRGETSGILV